MGTSFTNTSVGLNGTLGIINLPYSDVKSKFQVYLYAEPLLNVIGYDATLQGGLFNRNCSYSIPADQLERVTAQCNYGVIIQNRRHYFEYSRTIITREFESGSAAKWGGIKAGFKF